MGKSKLKRPKKTNVFDPTGLMNVKGSVEVEANCKSEAEKEENGVAASERGYDTIVSLMRKLQTASADERECACLTLAGLVSSSSIPLMLRAGTVKVVAPLMLDAAAGVRHAAVGMLRNMSADASPDLAAVMVKEDVMTALVSLLRQCSSAHNSEPVSKETASELATFTSETQLNAVHLLWNLCESNEVAVSVFNGNGLLALLLPWLSPTGSDYSLSLAVARCLHAVTDNNSEAVRQVAPTEVFSLLDTLTKKLAESNEELLLQTLAAGIAYNVTNLTPCDSEVIIGVVEVLGRALVDDVVSPSHQVAALLPKSPEVAERLESHSNLVASQQLAAEILTNMCCPPDDGDDWEECNHSDTSGEDIAMDTDMEGFEEQAGCLHVSDDIHSLLATNNIVGKIISKCKLLDSSLVVKLETHTDGKEALKRVLQLQCRCLLCLANMVGVLSVDTLGGEALLTEIWTSLMPLTLAPTVVATPSLLGAVTSAMRATSHRLAQLDSQKLCEVTPADLQVLYQLGRQCLQDGVRTNAVRIVCTVGCSLAQHPPMHLVLKGVGEFLFSVAMCDARLCVVAEALDAIFDVFADDSVDQIVREIDLVSRLKTLMPGLKTKFQQQKRHLGEHHAIVSTAKTNLARFIAYKMQ